MNRASRHRGRAMVLAAAACVMVLFSTAATAVAASPIRPASGDNSVGAVVSFNGVPVASHDSLGSAIPTSFSGQFQTVFRWSSTAFAGVTQGEISILFFGAAIGTSSQQVAEYGTSGTVTLNSSLTQNQYLYEGVYEIHAVLLDNSSTVFSQDFYVWVQATDHLTAVNVLLIVIILLEIYEIAMLGSVKRAKEQFGSSTPSSPPPAAPLPASPPATPPSGGS